MKFLAHMHELVVHNILKNRDDRIMFTAKNDCFSKTRFLKNRSFADTSWMKGNLQDDITGSYVLPG